jgi:segregation and condensation protein B
MDEKETERNKNKRIVEAALFVSGDALSESQLRGLISQPSKTKDMMNELMQEYKDENRAMEIVDIGGRYVMQVKPAYGEFVKHLVQKELGDPLLRTLSIIAYNQPLTQADVVRAMGNRAYERIRELKKCGFIKTKQHGHTKLIETTRAFEEYFNLKSKESEKQMCK